MREATTVLRCADTLWHSALMVGYEWEGWTFWLPSRSLGTAFFLLEAHQQAKPCAGYRESSSAAHRRAPRLPCCELVGPLRSVPSTLALVARAHPKGAMRTTSAAPRWQTRPVQCGVWTPPPLPLSHNQEGIHQHSCSNGGAPAKHAWRYINTFAIVKDERVHFNR